MMLSTLLVFVPVYALAVASPGPAVAAIVARTLGRGRRGSGAFIAGLVAGDLTWFATAVLGLTLVAQTYAPLFQAMKYAGAAYLLYMAWQIWRAPPAPPAEAAQTRGGGGFGVFVGAYLLTLGNPKTMVFFLSIMPLVVDPAAVTMTAALELALVIALVLSTIFLGYVLLADRARRLFRSERALRRINRGTAGVMAGTALVVASR
ncbi:MAG: LysE family translocator [Hyphomicrobiales bacterium]|uniref:LysE family translocator n=1 Tax=Rhabdaerophilum calidifontis TaxID=2604328 RepID=UPI00123BBEBB|nr:LysE family translocator [Rhabdaerophilum calidifontis]MCA1952127.1 LysE family translocator [Hyphomicrobiales bacterium]MCA1999087.1 LysE family translocator [Hyphomicrobiales bacterium]